MDRGSRYLEAYHRSQINTIQQINFQMNFRLGLEEVYSYVYFWTKLSKSLFFVFSDPQIILNSRFDS